MKILLLAFVVTQIGIDLIAYGWLSSLESRLYTLEDADYSFRNKVLKTIAEIESILKNGRRAQWIRR